MKKLTKTQRIQAKKNLGKIYLAKIKSSLQQISKIINEKEYVNSKDIGEIEWSLNWLDRAVEDFNKDQSIDHWYEIYEDLLTHGIQDQSDFRNWCHCEAMFKDVLMGENDND